MKTIAIINRAGGTSKTQSTKVIGEILAERGPVLMIDLDSQGDLTNQFFTKAPDKTVASLFDGGKLPIYPANKNLDIIAANANLAAIETRMEATDKFLLAEAIKKVDAKYDFCLLDCPPSLGWISINALTAADKVFVPVHTDRKAIDGLARMAQACYMAGTPTKIDGVFFTRFNPNTKISHRIVEEIQANYGDLLFATKIRNCVKVSEAAFNKMGLIQYAPKCTAALDYVALVDEILERI